MSISSEQKIHKKLVATEQDFGEESNVDMLMPQESPVTVGIKSEHMMCNPMVSMQQRGRTSHATNNLEPKALEEIKELQMKTTHAGRLDLAQKGLTQMPLPF